MKRPSQIVIRGALAGFLAATALALWFLIIDVLQARALRTPAFLASVLAGLDEVEIGFGLIAMYTALHYAVFITVGVAVAWIMSKLERVPGLLLGVVLGFLLFDVIFYAGIIVTGVDVVKALGWPQVLIGNILAGVVLTGTLYLTSPIQLPTWRATLHQHRIVEEGIVAGLIGASVVAVWFLVFDVVRGRVFFTPGALGSALFFGAAELADVQVNATTVLGYTGIHLLAFFIGGLVLAAVVTEAEREPPLVLGLVLLFVTFETLFIGLLAIFASWLLGVLSWWTIAVGNLLAAVAMGTYLWRQHPLLRAELSHDTMHLEEPSWQGDPTTAPADSRPGEG
ncbi:MAG: hypothetical protein HY561_01280 [Gemmatimonadetes bacterium]|nr:hypothetical protein [Gemmatimonadota bacterium]